MNYFVKRDDNGVVVGVAATMQYEPSEYGEPKKPLKGWTGEQLQDTDPSVMAIIGPKAQP